MNNSPVSLFAVCLVKLGVEDELVPYIIRERVWDHGAFRSLFKKQSQILVEFSSPVESNIPLVCISADYFFRNRIGVHKTNGRQLHRVIK